jgi:hypothetical protein
MERVASAVFQDTDKDVLTNFVEFAASFAGLLEIRGA